MTIYSCGYFSPVSFEKTEAFDLFVQNLTIIRDHEEDILNCGDYFFCELPFAYCSWPYISGDGPRCRHLCSDGATAFFAKPAQPAIQTAWSQVLPDHHFLAAIAGQVIAVSARQNSLPKPAHMRLSTRKCCTSWMQKSNIRRRSDNGLNTTVLNFHSAGPVLNQHARSDWR